MAQTAPPLPGDGTPRPLPRGGRASRARDTRPRFQPLDGLWVALLAVPFILLGASRHASAADLCAGSGIIALTYLIGWRSAGRSAGVIAGLLLTTSAAFATAASHEAQMDLFALACLGALFAFVAGSSVAALALAAVAVWLRADGAALGLMLMAFTLIQHRRRAPLGALIFFLPTAAALAVPQLRGGHALSPIAFGFHPTLLTGLAAPAMLFVLWFLLPFLGEMVDPIRRARWLPTVTWTVLSAVLASLWVFGNGDPAAVAVPFLPLWFLLAGAGLARLLPAMTGDLPIPWLRYAVAILAVLSLLAIRARVEWAPAQRQPAAPARVFMPLPSPAPIRIPPSLKATPVPAAPKPITPVKPPKPVPFHTANPITVHPVRPAKLKPPKPVRAAHAHSTKPNVSKPRSVMPAVRRYIVKNGRLVHRSKWAIEWNVTHPHPGR